MLYHTSSQYYRMFLSSAKGGKTIITPGTGNQKIDENRGQAHPGSVGV